MSRRAGVLEKRIWAAGILAALASAASGCGGAGETAADEVRTTTTATAPESPTTVETVPGATTPSGETIQDTDTVIAAREGAIRGERVRLEIAELERSGGTVALTFRLKLILGPERGAENKSAWISGIFDDGVSQADDYATLDGISLIDTKNRKRYLVARDSAGVCVCDGNLGSATLRGEAPFIFSATFGAPPQDVAAVDVVIPRFGTFKDVPIS
jgi:hypothetical protein